MTREEAIAIIRKEYLCVDRDCDIEKNCGKCDLVMPSKEPILEAFKMAIKALEQEPCGDCVSREAVDTLVDELARAISDERCHIPRGRSTAAIMQDILDLPSVNPQPEEDCYTCKYRYFETWHCVNCRGRCPSHYERRA